MRLRTRIVIWIALSVAGGTVLIVPDSGERLFSFSGAHGLTALDASGTALLFIGWVPILTWTWTRRHRIRDVLRPCTLDRVLLATGAGLAFVLSSAFGDFSGWWAVGSALLLVSQGVLLVVLARG